MSGRDIVAIGASAGGVEALLEIVRGLPADLPVAVLVVLHCSRHRRSILPGLLARRSALPATQAVDGESIRPGRIYVAPPDYHMLVRRGSIHLAHTAAEHHMRPAIDPTFRSAAQEYGSRVIGVLLTGMQGDGAMGLLTIKRYGGIALVQHPDDALYPEMPLHAIQNVEVDEVLPVSQLIPALVRLTREPLPRVPPRITGRSDGKDRTVRVVREQEKRADHQPADGPAIFTCPECGGTLWQADEQLIQFRCHVGHVYEGEELLNDQADATESRLWEVLRYLVDQSILVKQLETAAERKGRSRSAEQLRLRAATVEKQAAIIRGIIEDSPVLDPLDEPASSVAGSAPQ